MKVLDAGQDFFLTDLVDFGLFEKPANLHRINIAVNVKSENLLFERTHDLHNDIHQNLFFHSVQQENIPDFSDRIQLKTSRKQTENPVKYKKFVIQLIFIQKLIQFTVSLPKTRVDFATK